MTTITTNSRAWGWREKAGTCSLVRVVDELFLGVWVQGLYRRKGFLSLPRMGLGLTVRICFLGEGGRT